MDRIKKEKNSNRILALTGVSAVLLFAALLFCVLADHTSGFDDPVRSFFYNLRCDALTPAVKAVTYMGNWQSITALCIAPLLIKPTRITYGIPVSAGAIFVTVLNKLIKAAVQRPRPDDVIHLIREGGFSFPSGHSITSMFVFGLLICLVRSNVRNKTAANVLTAVLSIPMILIGLSRIYLGVYYPTDVLAGWCLGIAVTAAVIGIKRIF